MIVFSRLLRRARLLSVAAMAWIGGFSIPVALAGADNIAYQGSFPPSTSSGMTQATLTIGGVKRDLLIYRPSTAESLPLMIFFEGTDSTLASVTRDDQYFSALADAGPYIIAVPLSRAMTYGDWDNHPNPGIYYWETAVGDLTTSAVSNDPNTNPDLLFTRAIIKEASVAYGADLTRVYVNGYSNGAFFSYFVATTLSDRIAAFAETSGGLVLSNTTFGNPTACAPPVLPTAATFRTCADAGWTPGLCSDPTAMARPAAPTVSVPPGFMEAQDGDPIVPFAHTCNLANALPASPNYQVRIVHGNQHGWSPSYLDDAWNFMKNFRSQSIAAISFSPVTLTVGGTVTAIATASSGLAVRFSSLTPGVCTVSGSAVTDVAAGICTIAADQLGSTAYNAAPQITQNIAVGSTPPTVNLVPSWNLVGNSVNAPLTVAVAFGDASKVSSVWKWMPTAGKWAFYSPAMTALNLAAYASDKGYDVLSTVNGGEGFWVNAKIAFAVQLPAGIAIGTSVYADQATPPNRLPMGWSLIAVGDDRSPRNFVNALAINHPVAPAVAATSITSLWAWDSTMSNWYFYAPSLENNGTLANYITAKSYLDFGARTLDPTTGFWVNHP